MSEVATKTLNLTVTDVSKQKKATVGSVPVDATVADPIQRLQQGTQDAGMRILRRHRILDVEDRMARLGEKRQVAGVQFLSTRDPHS